MNDLPKIDEIVMLYVPYLNKELQARFLGIGVKPPDHPVIDYIVFQCFPENEPSFSIVFNKDKEIKWRRQ